MYVETLHDTGGSGPVGGQTGLTRVFASMGGGARHDGPSVGDAQCGRGCLPLGVRRAARRQRSQPSSALFVPERPEPSDRSVSAGPEPIGSFRLRWAVGSDAGAARMDR